MQDKVQKIIGNNGFLRTVRNLVESDEVFVELMEMDGEARMQVMSHSTGKVTQADIDAARKKMANWKNRAAANN